MADRSPAAIMEALAADAHSLAFDLQEPRTSHRQAERIIEEGERIAAGIRAVVRGRPCSS